jgi:hypothetical protein
MADLTTEIDISYDERSHEDEQMVDTRIVMTAAQAAKLRQVLGLLVDTGRMPPGEGTDFVQALADALDLAADQR